MSTCKTMEGPEHVFWAWDLMPVETNVEIRFLTFICWIEQKSFSVLMTWFFFLFVCSITLWSLKLLLDEIVVFDTSFEVLRWRDEMNIGLLANNVKICLKFGLILVLQDVQRKKKKMFVVGHELHSWNYLQEVWNNRNWLKFASRHTRIITSQWWTKIFWVTICTSN